MLANSSWCVWTAQKQLANMLANCWRQIELVSILANFFANFFVLANSNLTCERLANVCCYLSTNQNTRFSHVICVTLHKMADEDRDATFKFIGTFHRHPIRTQILNKSWWNRSPKSWIWKAVSKVFYTQISLLVRARSSLRSSIHSRLYPFLDVFE